MNKKESIIENLKTIYKLDLKLILNDILNDGNFLDYYNLVEEVVESLRLEKNEDLLNNYANKLIEFGLKKLSVGLNGDKFQVLDSRLDFGFLESNADILLKYFKLLISNCSPTTTQALFKVYLIYFSKILVNYKFNLDTKIICLLDLSSQFCDPIEQDLHLTLKQINFLNNFFNLIQSNLNKIHFDSNLLILVEFLIENSFRVVYKLNDSPYLLKLCLNNLLKIGSVDKTLKNLVLNKLCLNLSDSVNQTQLKSEYLNKKRDESFVQDINLNILTSLADLIVSFENELNFLEKSEYWNLIQIGLSHTNSLSRKQALYLLKRTNDLAQVNNIKINSFEFDTFDSQVCLYASNWSCWDDFFLCIELLEETSVHIIKPSLAKINILIEQIKLNKFHYTWFLVLLSRAFLHESKYIVRWAINSFLKSDMHLLINSLRSDKNTFTNNFNSFILKPFLVTLQKAYIFKRAEDTEFIDYCPKIAILLSNFINSYLNSLPNKSTKIEFLQNFTTVLNNYSWNATCLMFISKSLFDLDQSLTYNLNTTIIKNIHKIITCALTTQEVLLRSSTQTFLIKFLTKHVQPSDLDEESLKNMVDIINALSIKECLSYHNSTWKLLIDWFKQVFEEKKNINLVSEFLNQEFKLFTNESILDQFSIFNQSQKLAKFLLIIFDTDQQHVYNTCVNLISDRLSNCNRYVYMNPQTIEKTILVLNQMISLTKSSNFGSNFNSYLTVQALHNQVIVEIIEFIVKKCDFVNQQAFMFENLFDFMELIENFLKFESKSNEFLNSTKLKLKKKITEFVIPSVLASITENSVQKNFSSEWKRFINLSLLTALINTSYRSEVLNQIQIQKNLKFVDVILNLEPPSKSSLLKLNKDLDEKVINNLFENYSIFNGKFCQLIWTIYDFVLEDLNKFIELLNNNLLDLVEYFLDKYKNFTDLTSPFFLSSLIRSCKNFSHLINKTQKNEHRIELVYLFKLIYKQIWQIQDDVRNFYDSFNQFLELILASEVIHNDQDNLFKNFIIEICKDVLKRSNEKTGIVKPLASEFFKFLSKFDSKTSQFFNEILISFLIFGDVYKKEKKYIKDIEVYVESLGGEFGTNQLIRADYINDSAIRMKALFFILNESSHLNQDFFQLMLNKLVEKDTSILGSNSKLYINSLVHRERFRIWQTLLSLLPKFEKNSYSFLMNYAEQNLITETQPSIRILIEWTILRLVLSQIDTYDLNILFSKLENFSSKKVGYTSSWLTILTNLAPLLINEKTKIDYLTNLVPIILSQILSSNFHIRTYVEATLIKIHKMLNESIKVKLTGLNDPSIVQNEQIKILNNQIYSIIGPTLMEKDRHANILMSHFYFQFDPLSDYSIETIYYWLPYLSGLIEEEFVKKENFVSIILEKPLYELNEKDFDLKLCLPLNNPSSNLSNCVPGVWKFSALRDESLFEPNVSVEDLQKKIIPWHLLMPSQEDLENVNRKKISMDKEGLILVSSLIDKGTNLGGISRTCEIFNVKELIVGNIRFLEDKLFQNLSVTSEKWLNIKEVSLKHLKTYLLEMKYNGHVLIGLEQTAQSVQLNEFKFPANSVLVLGNEKEGIPVDIIQMLDYCVEIPQLGVIRSLNVHVSAAIAVWEYTKQHFLKID